MRVLLASAPHRDTFGYSMPPPGLLRLGAALEASGIPFALEDLAFRVARGDVPADDRLVSACADRLIAALDAGDGPALVGLSTMGATMPAALLIGEEIARRRPGARVVLGGPGTTGLDVALCERFPSVAAVARGEGEETLVELVRAWESGRDAAGVAGVTWRDGERVRREPERRPLDLARLAPTRWDLLPPLAEYKAITGEEEGLAPIDSGRGCVYDCSFCTIGRFWSRRSRPLPAALLADEIEALARVPGARRAYLCHDIFGADRRHAVELCETLLARGRPFPWECRARADHLDRELLELMARAGCYRVLLGIESADPAVREANQKGMRADVDLLRVVDDCEAAGIAPILSLILGLPGEDERALSRSLDFVADAALRAGVHVSLHLVNPQPGCSLGEDFAAASRPVILDARRGPDIPPDMARGAGETAPERELVAAHPDLFSTFAHLPLPPEQLAELAHLAAELPEILHRYPRTFAWLRRATGLDTLELCRRRADSGRSFAALVLADGGALGRDLLAWEEACVRAASIGIAREIGAPTRRAELCRLAHDVPAVAAALRAGRACGDARRETVLAVSPGASGVRTARTARIGPGVERLLGLVDGRTSLDELERRHPGMARALEGLRDHGLVALPGAAARTERTR